MTTSNMFIRSLSTTSTTTTSTTNSLRMCIDCAITNFAFVAEQRNNNRNAIQTPLHNNNKTDTGAPQNATNKPYINKPQKHTQTQTPSGDIIHRTGGCQCTCSSYTVHLQRAVGVSDILADFCHYGRSTVCWQIFQGKLH